MPAGAVKVGVVSDNPAGPGGASGAVSPRAAAGRAGGRGAGPAGGSWASARTPGGEPPKPPAGAWFPIPERYGDPHSSGLSGEVKPGRESELNIDLR